MIVGHELFVDLQYFVKLGAGVAESRQCIATTGPQRARCQAAPIERVGKGEGKGEG